MAVKYSLAQMRSNPGKLDSEYKFYAKAQGAGNMDISRICKSISHSGTAVRGDVLAVSDGLIHEMVSGLSEGMIVELGDFGHFQVQLSSTGAPTEKEFGSGNIRGAKIQFRPGQLLAEMLQTLKYELVPQKPSRTPKEPVCPVE